MATAGITKPTNAITFNSLTSLLKCKMIAYYAYGTLAAANKPTSLATLTTLLGDFMPMGDLEKDPIVINWKRDTIQLHLGKVRGQLSIEGSIKSLTNTDNMRKNLDEAASGADCTVILVPVNNPATPSAGTPAKALILPGVYLVDEGSLNGNNGFGGVTFNVSADPTKLSDVIWEITLTS